MAANFSPSVGSVVTTGAQALSVASLFNIPSSTNSATTSGPSYSYIDVTLFDRSEYPRAQLPQFGYFTGNGNTATPISLTSDRYGVGIVYAYQSATGQYYNATYGYLDQLTYHTSSTQYDNTYITLVGSNSLGSLTQTLPGNVSAISQDASNLAYYANFNQTPILGTVDVVTNTAASAPAPSAATPQSIVTVANTFKGVVWNSNGCWVLASNIAARAGSSLPIGSTFADGSAIATGNGEWIVAYNGAKQSAPSVSGAQQCLLPGDILTVAWSLTGPDRGGGHITTVVSGSGINSVVLDNVSSSNTYVDANDVYLSSHALNSSLVYNQAIASSIVVYRLDTPTITVNSASNTIISGSSLKLSGLFATTDAGGLGSLPITQYQFYDAGTGGAQNNTLSVNGVAASAHSSASAVSVLAANLSTVQLSTNSGLAGSDVVYVKAFNGSYWGDWATLAVQQVASIEVNSSQPYTVSSSNQALAGSTGIDTLVFNKASGNFTVNAVTNTNSWSIIDKTGVLGTTTVVSNERLQFNDGMVALDTSATQNAGSVYMLYKAAFNRPADSDGMGFWLARKDGGADIVASLAQGFVDSAEFTAKYGANPSNAAFVDKLYQNVLGRAGEASGVSYWSQQLNDGLKSKALVLAQFATLPEGASLVANEISHGITYKQWVG